MRKFGFISNLRPWRFRIAYCELHTPACAKRSGEGRPNSELSVRNRGFTLIEIIVLIVIAGIIIPVIIIPFATGIRGSKKPEMVTTAMYLAHQRMEELMKLDYQVLIANSYTGSGLTAITNAPIPNYQWQWEVRHATNANGFPLPSPDVDTGYMRIFVRVTDPENTAYDVYAVVTNFP